MSVYKLPLLLLMTGIRAPKPLNKKVQKLPTENDLKGEQKGVRKMLKKKRGKKRNKEDEPIAL